MDTATATTQIVQFARVHARPPSKSLAIADARERELAQALAQLRIRRPDPVLARRLDEVMPGWSDPQSAGWFERAEQVGLTWLATGRWPSQASYDRGECLLACWHTQQRGIHHQRPWAERFRPHTARKTTFLDASAPGWSAMVDHEATFRRSVAEVADWTGRNKQLPDGSSPDVTERKLARRLSRWKSAEKGRNSRHANRFTPERGAYLDRLIPGWRGTSPTTSTNRGSFLQQAKWLATAEDAARFIRLNGGLFPNRRSFDRAQRRLGWWCYEQRQALDHATDRMTPHREQWLDAHLAGWRDYMRRGAPGRPQTTHL
ncbi:hypothetical protein GCG21_08870 [Pseudactinotalea sp. HY160]|uniref:hypothetical protein n=1 Tax=Pseudactinotalea sp. HY160 TaxID=2654490 RepID=UPI00128E080B|nr:hypothetical protein [Pseudactinotalea sp. HY160]MPV50116.1 hypothetical protein [Pseudactinotalea sp. HY160]